MATKSKDREYFLKEAEWKLHQWSRQSQRVMVHAYERKSSKKNSRHLDVFYFCSKKLKKIWNPITS